MSETVETRGDERNDLIAADTNGDGKADLFQFDTNGDGEVDVTMVDIDQDTVPETVVDGDGGHAPSV